MFEFVEVALVGLFSAMIILSEKTLNSPARH
jgi:hypothetical protein